MKTANTIDQTTMEWIALAFGCLLGQVGFYPADWESGNPEPDLVIGTHNDWWLRRFDHPEHGMSLRIQMRYSDWLKNDSPLKGETSRYVIALRMQTLRREIEKLTSIHVELPFDHKDMDQARENRNI